MHTKILRAALPVTFHILASTHTNHMLMVRGRKDDGGEGWVLPHGQVTPGRCLILAARELLREQTGCERALTEYFLCTPTTDEHGTLNGLTYVLDGDILPDVPGVDPAEGASWVPMRELHEPPGLYQYAIIAAGQRRRLPLLINADRPEAAFL
ncbi:NUDIX domain-containing protein [Streptomyces sp. DSM 44915]|uniref:NUDIX domain-containing protein n=1 Tax=Streptomyces chisholmiae TaxID=3075540 RepID=A0ABU2K0D7_9ACTN|nr:NUDIX domain-containing protein [Streptomyces sp. DSM 44915]MDT0270677.1 NUDIX domain-containing protein [Streptomyces sp. DSM 44915]